MSKYMKNLYDVKVQRKHVCYMKNDIMYAKWPFPVANPRFNPTYAEKVNKSVLREILAETKNYKTVLFTPLPDLDKKYPDDLELLEKTIIYGLEQKEPFQTDNSLTFKTVKTKNDMLLWGEVASQIYFDSDTDFLYESFKADIGKKYATYFIFYKGTKPVGVSLIMRGGNCSALYWLGVLKEYRKQGIGTELTKQTLNYEISHKRYQFILSASEIGLIIYKKLGFRPEEILYKYSMLKHLQFYRVEN